MDTEQDDYLEEQLVELEAERDYMAEYVAERKPYWLNLRHPRGDALQWELNNYAPLAHYDRATTALEDRLDESQGDAAPDGGTGSYTPGRGRARYITGWTRIRKRS